MRKEELLRRIKKLRSSYVEECSELTYWIAACEGDKRVAAKTRRQDIEEFAEVLKELYTRAEPDDDQPTD